MGKIPFEALADQNEMGERGTFPVKTKMGLIALAAAFAGWLSPAAEALPEKAETTVAVVAVEETPVRGETMPKAEPSNTASGESSNEASGEASEEPAVEPSPEPTVEPAPEPSAVPEAVVCSTTIGSEGFKNYTSYDVDTEAVLAQGCALTLPAEGPQILIVHSHSCEAYTMEPGAEYEPSGDWRTLDEEQSVVAVGAALQTALQAQGLRVLHDTTLHDWPSYNAAYVESAQTIESYLAQYPSIAMVIDLHRDAIGDEQRIYKTVTDTTEPMAQLMFVVGSDQNLTHPNWRENLSLALCLQQAALNRCSTLMRPVDLSSCRYNQQLTTGSLILEVGTCGNTLAEAKAAVECFAEAVGPILLGMVEDAA